MEKLKKATKLPRFEIECSGIIKEENDKFKTQSEDFVMFEAS
jgi:hypothetical protein